MARRDDREQRGMFDAQSLVRTDDSGFLAGMGGRRRDYKPRADRILQVAQNDTIHRGWGHIELQITDAADVGCAETCVALSIGVGLGQAELEALKQSCNTAGYEAPALERALGHAAVNENDGYAAIRGSQNEIGPQIGFDKKREIGMPMIEKLSDKLWCIEGYELMHGAGRQPLCGKRRRSNGA